MEPPICAICDRDGRDHPDLEFDLVKFADYEPIDCPGHPDGLRWFCSNHLEKARNLENLTSQNAIKEIRKSQN